MFDKELKIITNQRGETAAGVLTYLLGALAIYYSGYFILHYFLGYQSERREMWQDLEQQREQSGYDNSAPRHYFRYQ